MFVSKTFPILSTALIVDRVAGEIEVKWETYKCQNSPTSLPKLVLPWADFLIATPL